jgi:membrane protein
MLCCGEVSGIIAHCILFHPVKEFDMEKNFTDLHQLLHFIAVRFKEDRCAQMAASLTFTTLLSLVPLITIALTLFSAFPVFEDFAGEIKNFLLSNMMPETGGKMISRYVEQFAESAAKLTAVGIVFLALTAMLMMHTIDEAFNTIWNVSRPRSLIQRVLIYWAVLTLAPLLVGGSLSLTSWLAGISVGYAKQVPELGVVMLKVVPVLLTTLAFSLLFRVVPNRFVPFRHALIGGVVAAAAFESMNQAFAYYISHFPTYKLVYGAFASFPIFLLWIYLSWLTILLGALIASSLSHWGGNPVQKISAAAKLYYALRILRLMDKGLHDGTVQTTTVLSKQLRIGFDALELLLEELAKVQIVRKLADKGWALIRDAEHIQVSELYRLFVFDPATMSARQTDAALHGWLVQMDVRVKEAATLSLSELFNSTTSTTGAK